MNKRLEEIRARSEKDSISMEGCAWAFKDRKELLDLVDTQAGILDEREKFIVKLGNELTDAAKEVSKLDKQIDIAREEYDKLTTNLLDTQQRELNLKKQIAEKDEVYDEWRGIAERQRDKLIAKDKQIAEGRGLMKRIYLGELTGGHPGVDKLLDEMEAWLKAVKHG